MVANILRKLKKVELVIIIIITDAMCNTCYYIQCNCKSKFIHWNVSEREEKFLDSIVEIHFTKQLPENYRF